MNPRSATRLGLVLLGLGQAGIGAWALLDTRGWFENFPGTGDAWLPAFGPYNDHLAIDVGSSFLALGALLVVAAVLMDRRLTIVALSAYLIYDLPHWIFHLTSDSVLSDSDQVANGALLTLTVLTAAGLLWLSGREDGPRHHPVPATTNGSAGRLAAPRRGLALRATQWYSKRFYGGALAPIEGYAHHRRLMFGYSAFELATERSRAADHRLKMLAALRASAVAGCEWCMDFGSHLALRSGLAEEELRDLITYWESDRFSELDRLVLDYATAMSRTPADVPDEMVARLREQLSDKQLVELTHEIAIENYRARFNHALGFEAQGFTEGRACIVPATAERPSRV